MRGGDRTGGANQREGEKLWTREKKSARLHGRHCPSDPEEETSSSSSQTLVWCEEVGAAALRGGEAVGVVIARRAESMRVARSTSAEAGVRCGSWDLRRKYRH